MKKLLIGLLVVFNTVNADDNLTQDIGYEPVRIEDLRVIKHTKCNKINAFFDALNEGLSEEDQIEANCIVIKVRRQLFGSEVDAKVHLTYKNRVPKDFCRNVNPRYLNYFTTVNSRVVPIKDSAWNWTRHAQSILNDHNIDVNYQEGYPLLKGIRFPLCPE